MNLGSRTICLRLLLLIPLRIPEELYRRTLLSRVNRLPPVEVKMVSIGAQPPEVLTAQVILKIRVPLRSRKTCR
jgi:hypothetical protein